MFYHAATNQYFQPGISFEIEGLPYPADWFYKATAEDIEIAGITSVIEVNPPLNSRFYWVEAQLIENRRSYINTPKNLDELKRQFILEAREQGAARLAQSDWRVIRSLETQVLMDAEWLKFRADLRAAVSSCIAAIEAAVDVPALEAVCAVQWPQEPQKMSP